MAYNDRGGNRFGGGGGGYRGGGRKFGGGGGGFRGGHGGGGRGGFRGEREMHQATCGDCGKSCEVPFRPTGEKPVYCRDCFQGKNEDSGAGRFDGGGGRNFNKRDSGAARKNYGDSEYSERPAMEMFDAVCSDCGKDCEVPFKPSSDKPIYCDKCFGRNKEIRGAKTGGGSNAKLDEKLTMINIKLDRILKVLDGSASTKENKHIESAPQKEAKSTPAKTPIIKGIEIVKKDSKPVKEAAPSKSIIKKISAKPKKTAKKSKAAKE